MLISILFGMLPEILYLWSFLLIIRKEKRHKLLFFILIAIAYIIFIPIIRYNYVLYLGFAISIYYIMKLLYKVDIINFFVIIALFDYMMLLSFSCYFAFDNYIIASVVNRILLFGPLLLPKRLNECYNIYRNLWNRNELKIIKSLTLRNISILILNTTIVLTYITLIVVCKYMM